MNRYILGLVLLFSTSLAFAQATDDNEINIDQEGDTLTLYIDQYGYGNKLGLDNFSSDSGAMVITGSTLNFNIDQIGNENLLYGPFNVFDVDIDVDDAVWNFDITGGTNNIKTLQKDGAEHEINLTHAGSGADIDINQISGTCPTGINTCNGIITLDIDSENATIQINQKDSANDS
ncbi:MAG: hypothetical protein EBX03_08365 [Rhodobacteraceae bacterium]|nr:hypothetical protein [Paracoccaceae bacterium]